MGWVKIDHMKSVIFSFMFAFSGVVAEGAADQQTSASSEEVRQLSERLSQLGNRDAQFNMGLIYYKGLEIEKNLVEAYAWFALAAEDGNEKYLQAQRQIFAELLETEQSAAKLRSEQLKARYGRDALNMSLIPELVDQQQAYCQLKPERKSYPIYPRPAINMGQQGWVDLEFSVDQNGIVRDPMVIMAIPRDAFDRSAIDAVLKFLYHPPKVGGQPSVVHGVRNRIIYKLEGDKSGKYKKELQAYRQNLLQKAQQGDAMHQYLYAYVTNSHPDMEKLDEVETSAWYLKAAQGGLAEAQYAVGRRLFYGEGCMADHGKAVEWLNASAKSDYPYAQLLLAKLLLQIEGNRESNTEKALFWLEKAVEKDFIPAKAWLGWLLATQDSPVLKDRKRALQLLTSVEDEYADKVRIY